MGRTGEIARRGRQSHGAVPPALRTRPTRMSARVAGQAGGVVGRLGYRPARRRLARSASRAARRPSRAARGNSAPQAKKILALYAQLTHFDVSGGRCAERCAQPLRGALRAGAARHLATLVALNPFTTPGASALAPLPYARAFRSFHATPWPLTMIRTVLESPQRPLSSCISGTGRNA